MKATFLWVGIQKMRFELIGNPLNGMNIIRFVDVYQVVIQVNNNKNIYLLCQYLIEIFLEGCQYIEKTKRYHLILKMTILEAKSYLLLVFFSNFDPIVNADQVKRGKLLSSMYLIQELANQKQQVLILDLQIMKILMIDT